MKFFVDENLSPLLVTKLNERGYPAEKPERVGLQGVRDDLVWAYAFEHDQIVITCNAEDFLTLARSSEIHAGLIILRPGDLLREEQWEILEPVIAKLESEGRAELLNEYIEVFDVGEFTWPPKQLPASAISTS